MGILNSLVRSLIKQATRSAVRSVGHKMTHRRLQKEASARPESLLVSTVAGDVWMSPIEVKLYEAMVRESLDPIPQFCIEGYFVDFAFPRVRVAVEADGAAYHQGARRDRDRKRDWVLQRHGWKILRFYGSTIHEKAANCAYVVKREVQGRR
jgi:very-short-patch-repair endonuclease